MFTPVVQFALTELLLGTLVPALRAYINQCVCSRIVLVNYTSAKAVPDWFKSTIPGTKMSCGCQGCLNHDHDLFSFP